MQRSFTKRIKGYEQFNYYERLKRAINTIKSNPRYFYQYARKSGKSKSGIGPLFDKDGILQNDPKKMADILQDQYKSVLSNPLDPCKRVPNHSPVNYQPSLQNIAFTRGET